MVLFTLPIQNFSRAWTDGGGIPTIDRLNEIWKFSRKVIESWEYFSIGTSGATRWVNLFCSVSKTGFPSVPF